MVSLFKVLFVLLSASFIVFTNNLQTINEADKIRVRMIEIGFEVFSPATSEIYLDLMSFI